MKLISNEIALSYTKCRCPYCFKLFGNDYIKEHRYVVIDDKEAIDCPECGSQLIINNCTRIPKKPTVYIHPNVNLRPDEVDRLLNDILSQKEQNGVVVVPSWCDVFYE